jgi:transposase-like protein
MRQVREVLQLKLVGGVATREIARRLGVAPSTPSAWSALGGGRGLELSAPCGARFDAHYL